jgi:3-dehydroquinate synthase
MRASHQKIRVRFKKTVSPTYDIRISPGLFGDLPPDIASIVGDARVFVITDANVKRLYGRQLMTGLLNAKVDAWLIDFPAGEASKNSGVVNSLHTQLLEHGVRRNSLILALGGGVVGDVAGYVAATILRGIKYIQVPTTLLAQVDSSVGGKVGIDHPLGKNLIGAFHQPEAVYIDPLVLRTLPEREFRSGLAEIVKIATALDESFFNYLEKNAGKIKQRSLRVLTELITRSVQLKAAVVGRDELETGLRKVLNLGHTIGHAVEAASNYTLRHGEAVAIGLAAESGIARDMGLLSALDYERLLRLMRALRLRTSFPGIRSKEKLRRALSTDKKSIGASMKFVLLNGIGCTLVGVDVPSPFINALVKTR